MKKSFLLIALSLVSGQALADHWVELDANYSFGTSSENFYSYESSIDIDEYSLAAQIYTHSISNELVPVNEAGFLSKVSSVYVKNDLLHYIFDFDGQVSRSHVRTTSFGGTAVIKDFTVGGSVESYSFDGEKYGDIYSLNAGYYLTDSALLSTGAGRFSIDESSTCSDCEDEYDENELSGSYYLVGYHQVFSLNNMMAFSVDAHWEKAAGNHRYGAEGTYYFSTKMGLTLGLAKNSGGDYSYTDKFVKYHLYMNETVGFNASYTDSESYGLDEDSVGLFSVGVSVNI